MWGENGNWFWIVVAVFSIVSIILTIFSIIGIKRDAEGKKIERIISSIFRCFTLLLTWTPYIVPNMTEYVFYNGSAEQLENMEKNYANKIIENAELEVENQKLKDDMNTLNEELDNIESENNELKISSKNIPSFKQYLLYNNGTEVTVNNEKGFAEIAGNLYLSANTVESLLDNTLNKDEENEIIYTGKYPEDTVDLLEVCEPYDSAEGFSLGKNSSFKIKSKVYTEGFELTTWFDSLRSVKFYLDSKYTELTFNIGHIDESNTGGNLILNIYVDQKRVKQIICNSEMDIDNVENIPLNNGKELKFEWCSDGVKELKYGIINAKLK